MSASHWQQYSNAFRNRLSLRRVRCWPFARGVFCFLFPMVLFFAAIIYSAPLRAAAYHERKMPCWVWLPVGSLTNLLITTCADRWWWGFTLLEKDRCESWASEDEFPCPNRRYASFRLCSCLLCLCGLGITIFVSKVVMRVRDWWWHDIRSKMIGQMWNDGWFATNSSIVSGLIRILTASYQIGTLAHV
jgi:hypothetical protein